MTEFTFEYMLDFNYSAFLRKRIIINRDDLLENVINIQNTLLEKMYLKIRTWIYLFFPSNFDSKMSTRCSQF